MKKQNRKEQEGKDKKFNNIFEPLYKEGLPLWAKIIVWAFFIILAPEALNIFYVLFIMLSLYCGMRCFEWASEIEKPKSQAYLFGFLFSLLGLLVYWGYYGIKKGKMPNWVINLYCVLSFLLLIIIEISLVSLLFEYA